MGLTVKYNEHTLSEHMEVLEGFTSFVGAEWGPEMSGDTMKSGDEFVYTKYTAKHIEMPFFIKGNLKDKYDQIEKILNVSKPQKLIFGNIPERFFYAVPSGNLSFDEIKKTAGRGTITWLIPDGLAHSVTQKEFAAAENADGVLEVTVVNEGTEAVPVDYTIAHQGDNGYIGIVSEYGVIELGNFEEVDGVMKEKSETLVDLNGYSSFIAMTMGSGYFSGNYNMDGTFMAVSPGNQKNWLGLDTAGTGDGWHGAAKTMVIPADSNGVAAAKNFCLQSEQIFSLDVGQLGIMEICITDTEANPLMSFKRAAYTPERNAYDAILTIGDKEVCRETYVLDSEYVSGAEGELTTENIESYKLAPIMMKKNGEFFKFRYGAGERLFVMPDLADKQAYVISVFLGERGTYPRASVMAIGSLSFCKDKVDNWKDLPNRYMDGTEVRIDGEKTKIYVNNVENAEDEVRGSKYFLVPPGKTKIRFYFSSFCETKPAVTAKIREAYL